MHPILALCLAIGVVATPTAPRAPPVAVVPEEPEAVVLDEIPTLQAVVADLDADGARELVRLVRLDRDDTVLVEAWRHDGSGWAPAGRIEVVPPGGDRFDVAFDTTPARLVVRRVGNRDQVTLVRQPHFKPPGLEPECCLQLHDVVVDGEALELVAVGSADEAVDAILALDLDGDGTDELLASRSLRPLGRTAYPSEALVYRWTGERFSAPVRTELPVGSGDTPFVLGETDGRPGAEAGLIGTAAQSRLYRIVLGDDDRVRAESAGAVVSAVTAVSVDARPAVAIIGPTNGLSVHRWPAGEALEAPMATRPIADGRLIGGVSQPDQSILVLDHGPEARLEGYTLPDLRDHEPMSSTAAAAAMAATGLRPYRGPLPGGGPDGAPALVHDGILSAGGVIGDGQVIAALADAQPIGLAGPDGSWMVVAHGMGPSRLDPTGGRLEPFGVPVEGTISIVPTGSFLAPERDGGALEPRLVDAFVLDDQGTIGTAASGFGVILEAPAGSRAHVGLGAGETSLGVQVVPADGVLEVRIPLPRSVLPYAGDLAWAAVTTPAGGTYVATWNVLALTGPPPLRVSVDTPIGSPAVEVRGETVPYAEVTVDGRTASVDGSGSFVSLVDLPPWPTAVEVVAVDPVGNEARSTLTGVGLLDYRALPWIPITVALLVGATAALYVRAPRGTRAPFRGDDGSGLEELDPEREA